MASGKKDALGSLFDDLNLGIKGGDVFQRPKSMSALKSQAPVPQKTPISSMAQKTAPHQSQPVIKQEKRHATPPAVNGDDLDALFGSLSSSTRPTSTTTISQQQPPPSSSSSSSQQPTDTLLDLGGLDALSAAPPSSSTTHAAPSTSAVEDDIFGMGSSIPLNNNNNIPPPTNHHDDDDMFGVFSLPSKPAASAVAATVPVVADADESPVDTTSLGAEEDGDLPGFDNQTTSTTTVAGQQQQQPSSSSLAASNTSNRGSRQDLSSSTPQDIPPPPYPEDSSQQQQPSFAQRISSDSNNTQLRRHRAFDYLEPVDDDNTTPQPPPPYTHSQQQQQHGGSSRHNSVEAERTSATAAGSGFNPLSQGAHHHSSSSPTHHHHTLPPTVERTQEVVAEIGQKAAKMLSTGGKWFAKASKNLAKEVQVRMEKHNITLPGVVGGSGGAHDDPHQQQHHSRPQSVVQHSQGGATPSYFYEWASQLARISPDSRAAALAAMAEEDAMAVQRILDENELGERHEAALQQQQQQQQDLPPPAYNEAVAKPTASQSTTEQQPKQQQAKPAAAPKPKPPPPEPEADFLGMSDGPSAAASATTAHDDLMGFGAEESSSTRPSDTSEADIAAMFSVGGSGANNRQRASRPASANVATTGTTTSRGAAAAATTAAAGGGLDSMIDLGAEVVDVDTSGFDALYADGAETTTVVDANEPEIRKTLRAKRIAEKHARMMQQLAEKRARDEEEEAERQGKVELRDVLKPRIDAWSHGKKDNIRALLSSLHTVLWPDSGWTAPNMSDMVDNNKVKKVYMKANLIVHPDKVKQKGGTLEQIAVADAVFDVLKGAWGKFEASTR